MHSYKSGRIFNRPRTDIRGAARGALALSLCAMVGAVSAQSVGAARFKAVDDSSLRPDAGQLLSARHLAVLPEGTADHRFQSDRSLFQHFASGCFKSI